MIETIHQIDNCVYPFDEINNGRRAVKVTDVQTFSSMKLLNEKKNEMQIKNKIINSPYLIRMMNIYQQELTLHYFYQYVPYSLSKYIQKHYKQQKADMSNTPAKLLLKKISFDLTSLISYLANLKVEIDLCIENLGMTEDEKLKLYMNTKCRMGHKTEVSLVAYYSHCKEKIMNYIQSEFNLIKQKEDHPPNFVIKGNKLVFPTDKLNQSIYSHSNSNYQPETEYESVFNTTQDSNLLNSSHFSCHKSTPSCTNPLPRTSNLRQTQSPNFTHSFNFSEAKGSSSKSTTKIPKNHKGSFQFGAAKSQADRSYTNRDNDNSDAKSFTHSRSIRIELQQKIDPSLKRQRKDSYKVKITTFHEYQMDDCNPKDIFNNADPQKRKDLFEYFEKQAKNQDKSTYQNEQEQNEYTSIPSKPGPFERKQSMPDYGCTTPTSSQNIEQKVRMAKEKAENILNRYMKSKKKTLSSNKFGQ